MRGEAGFGGRAAHNKSDCAMDASRFNCDLDQRLRETGTVDVELFRQLRDAYGYGAAASAQWIDAKFGVLRQRLADVKTLNLHNPSGAITVREDAEFEQWVSRHFPGHEVRR